MDLKYQQQIKFFFVTSTTITITITINIINIYKHIYRVTISSPSPKELGYEPNESNTINLLIVGERAELLANGTTVSKDLKYEQT